MQNPDLFLELAGIGGVFVGFGALIAVRGGGARNAREVSPVRGVVLAGTAAVLASLAPVTLSQYRLDDHFVWLISSLVALGAFFGLMFVFQRTPEYRAVSGLRRPGRSGRVQDLIEHAAMALYLAALVLIGAIIGLGMAPDLESALYFTLSVLILLMAVWALLWLVLSHVAADT